MKKPLGNLFLKLGQLCAMAAAKLLETSVEIGVTVIED